MTANELHALHIGARLVVVDDTRLLPFYALGVGAVLLADLDPMPNGPRKTLAEDGRQVWVRAFEVDRAP